MNPAPRGPAAALAAVILLALVGAGLSWLFVEHVLARGDKIVDEPIQSPAAATPLWAAGGGVACLAVSGTIGLWAPSLRGRRWAPLVALGAPWAFAAGLGVLAFTVGPPAFAVSIAFAVPTLVAALLAVVLPPPRDPGFGRFLLSSWMALGTLAGLVVVAWATLGALEEQKPSVPWSSVLAGLGLATLLQTTARYAARHGGELRTAPRLHQQVRTVHETPTAQAVAARLHAYVEEGVGSKPYHQLTAELAQAAGSVQTTVGPAPGEAGRQPLPAWAAGSAALLRALAFALPFPALLPDAWGLGLGLLAAGLLLPLQGAALAPRKEPLRPIPWTLGGLLAAGGGYLLGPLLLDGAPSAQWMGSGIGLPLLFVAAIALRRRAPEGLATMRLAHAEQLAGRSRTQVARGAIVALLALGLPVLLGSVAFLLGIEVQDVPVQVPLAGFAAGALWSLAGLVTGPAAGPHREAMRAAQAARVEERRAAHRSIVESLESI